MSYIFFCIYEGDNDQLFQTDNTLFLLRIYCSWCNFDLKTLLNVQVNMFLPVSNYNLVIIRFFFLFLFDLHQSFISFISAMD